MTDARLKRALQEIQSAVLNPAYGDWHDTCQEMAAIAYRALGETDGQFEMVQGSERRQCVEGSDSLDRNGTRTSESTACAEDCGCRTTSQEQVGQGGTETSAEAAKAISLQQADEIIDAAVAFLNVNNTIGQSVNQFANRLTTAIQNEIVCKQLASWIGITEDQLKSTIGNITSFAENDAKLIADGTDKKVIGMLQNLKSHPIILSLLAKLV